ncbi:MAG TPA: LysM peptidoglycan-binding domain-containing protein [Bacteroidales bacterium]|nr:LysM peptidoglycan-binding domain-containing protein [Bacteroidales bacterium]
MLQHKKYNSIVLLLLPPVILFFAIVSLSGFSKNNIKTEDPVHLAAHIDSLVKYRTYYPFIHYEKNYIEWFGAEGISNFFHKVSQTGSRKLKILHIGDSHIQADIPSGFVRERLQEAFGYGGRGLVFPFKAAGTHAAYDYKTSCSGKWGYSRNIQRDYHYDMGLVGATIHTGDSTASFKLVFREGYIRENFTLLKIYCKQDSLSFDLKVKTSPNEAPVYVDCNDYTNSKPYVVLKMAKATDTLEVFVNKTEAKQNFFECYGLMIENDEDRGVLYNSTGINGAGYVSLLRQHNFAQQLNELSPDLVIIDLGANDFNARGYNDAAMESNLVRIINMIQDSAPEAAILISNAQDIYYRRKYNVAQCKDFMQMTKRVAQKHNCAFYNYYTVSGGLRSMDQWYKNGLARKDKVHLSAPGYYIRGELLLNAMLNSYVMWLQYQSDTLIAEQHIIDTLELKKYFDEEINFKTVAAKPTPLAATNHEDNDPVESDVTYYKIRKGDNLGAIAERFGVRTSQLQQWNALSGTKIIAGATLVIYKKSNASAPVKVPEKPSGTKPTNESATMPTQTARQATTKKSYKVVSGDSLWSIAKKFNTTVEKIKQLNGLKTDRLNINQILLIP